MEQEIWKSVIGFEGIYEVSNFGYIRSLRCNRGKTGETMPRKVPRPIARPKNQDGYLSCKLKDRERSKSYLVHRLVAIHFIDNPKNLPEVDHVDNDRANCHHSNLRWISRKNNILRSFTEGNRIRQAYPQKLSEQDAVDICTSTESKWALAKKYNISVSHVREIKRGKVWASATQHVRQ